MLWHPLIGSPTFRVYAGNMDRLYLAPHQDWRIKTGIATVPKALFGYDTHLHSSFKELRWYNKCRISAPKKVSGSVDAACLGGNQPTWLTGILWVCVRSKHYCPYKDFASAQADVLWWHQPQLPRAWGRAPRLLPCRKRKKQRVLCHLRFTEDQSINPFSLMCIPKENSVSVFITAIFFFRTGTCFLDTSTSQGQMYGDEYIE